MNKMGYIYSLTDPRNNTIKYIGQTRFKLKKRYCEHLRNSTYDVTKNQNIYRWINELKKENLLPIINEVEYIDVSLLNQREEFWIKFYGDQLLNMVKGGKGIKFIKMKPFTVEHRRKLGDAHRGEKCHMFGKPAPNNRIVYMFNKETGNFIKEYPSIKKAGEDNNMLPSAISQCLSKKRNSSNGYIWLYKEDYINNPLIINDIMKKCITNPSNDKKSIIVKKVNIETNEIVAEYKSIKEAARLNNTSDRAVSYAVRESKTNIYLGFKWIGDKN